jgi:hypothetical protein
MNPKISGVALNPFYNATVKTITGTTALTILQKVFVPAGTYEAGDLLIVNMLIGKIGTAGTFTYYLYSSPNDPDVSGISGATQLSVIGTASTSLFIDQGRHLYIKNTTGGGSGIELGTELAAVGTALFNEMRSATTSNVAINWSNGVYLFVAGQLVSSADRIDQYYLKIWDY